MPIRAAKLFQLLEFFVGGAAVLSARGTGAKERRGVGRTVGREMSRGATRNMMPEDLIIGAPQKQSLGRGSRLCRQMWWMSRKVVLLF